MSASANKTSVEVFFNYRSPYCYLASLQMWTLEDEHGAEFAWRPLGGWAGRSPPDRVKQKLLVVRQDCARWAKRLGKPFVPPPPTTDGTLAAIGALHAVQAGRIRPYTIFAMRAAWGEGRDIGQLDVLLDVAESAGMDRAQFSASLENQTYIDTLAKNAAAATDRGIFGVPTFAIGPELFWGQDRIDFVAEHLEEIRR